MSDLIVAQSDLLSFLPSGQRRLVSHYQLQVVLNRHQQTPPHRIPDRRAAPDSELELLVRRIQELPPLSFPDMLHLALSPMTRHGIEKHDPQPICGDTEPLQCGT